MEPGNNNLFHVLKRPRNFKPELVSSNNDEINCNIEHVYISGYGFVNESRECNEKRYLGYIITCIGLCLFLFGILSIFSNDIIYLIFDILNLDNLFINSVNISNILFAFLNNFILVCIPTFFLILWIKPYVLFNVKRLFKIPKLNDITQSAPIIISLSLLSAYFINILSQFLDGLNYDSYNDIYYMFTNNILVAYLINILASALFPAIFEELLFRGVIMQSLRKFGSVFALIVSSLLFGLAHFNLYQFINASILGFFIGVFVIKYQNLTIGMVLHFLNNFLSITFSMLYIILDYNNFIIVLIFSQIVFFILGIVSIIHLDRQNFWRLKLGLSKTKYTLLEKLKFSLSNFCLLVFIVYAIVTIISNITK